MGPKKRNKKNKKGNSANAEPEASTSASAAETHASTSYAAAAAQPPAEDNEVVETTSGTSPADDATVPAEPAADPPTSGAGPTTAADPSGDDAFGDGGSDYSRIKKDEISNAGSAAQVIEDSDNKNVSVSIDSEAATTPAAEKQSGSQSPSDTTAKDAGGDGTAAEDNDSDATALPAGDTPAKTAEAGPDPVSSVSSAISRVDAEGWGQTFGSGSSSPVDSESAYSAAIIHQTEELDQEFDEHADRVALQDCQDKLDHETRARQALMRERDALKEEVDLAHETLADLSKLRRDADANSKERKIRETALEAEIQALKAELAARDAKGASSPPPRPPPPPPPSDPNSPSDSGGGGGSGGPGSGPHDAELRQLRDAIARHRADLATTNAALARVQQRARHTAAFRAGVAACATENEKLARFGGSLDASSPLYAALRTLADAADNGDGPPALTRAEAALIGRFQATLAERKFAIAAAMRSEDPRGLLEPRMDAWEHGEGEWGSTLRDRITETRQALHRLPDRESTSET